MDNSQVQGEVRPYHYFGTAISIVLLVNASSGIAHLHCRRGNFRLDMLMIWA